MMKDLLKLIPSSVRIKSKISYEVVFIKEFPNQPDQVGECRHAEKQIVIKEGQSQTETFKTLIHESLHAINFENKKLKLTENQTGILENALYKVLKLNKLI